MKHEENKTTKNKNEHKIKMKTKTQNNHLNDSKTVQVQPAQHTDSYTLDRFIWL